jgi:hypothetical protein
MPKLYLHDFVGMVRAVVPNYTKIQQNLVRLMAQTRAEWIRVSKDRLLSTQRAYVSSILPEIVDEYVGSVTLDGSTGNGFVDGIEWGMKPWDLRTTILKGRPFVRVPFDYNISKDASGVNGQIPGSAYGPMMIAQFGQAKGMQEAEALGNAVRAAAKALKRGQSLSADKGGPLLRTKQMIQRQEQSWHSTGIYTRMQRGTRKTGAGGTVSSYKTYRTISAIGGEPGSWHHPGLSPRKFHLDVLAFIEREAPKIWET